MWQEYCERYAKKEHVTNQAEEDSDNEDISSKGSESSDDEIPGHADP